jgi:hypothetical protein
VFCSSATTALQVELDRIYLAKFDMTHGMSLQIPVDR